MRLGVSVVVTRDESYKLASDHIHLGPYVSREHHVGIYGGKLRAAPAQQLVRWVGQSEERAQADCAGEELGALWCGGGGV